MATVLRRSASSLRFLQRLIEVPKYIVEGFEPDREADHLRSYTCGALLVLGELTMRRRRRMNYQRFRVADIREVRQELHRLDEALARRGSAAHAERQDAARTARQIAARERLVAVTFEQWVIHPF